MKIIHNPYILFATLAWLVFSIQPSHAESVRYCENLGKKLHQYADVETVYADLVLKARRRAVEAVFSKELKAYKRDFFSKDEIVDALLPLVQYDEKIQKSTQDAKDAFNVCVNLENIRPKFSNDQKRFQPKRIAEICHFEESYVDEQIQAINARFIENLQKGNISRSVALMLNQPENLMPQTVDQLDRFTFTKSFKTDASYLSDLRCKALHLYPIDLYIASSPREISSAISLLPPVIATDKKGSKAKFQIIIIHRDYNWKKGSTSEVVKEGKVVKGFKNTFTNPRFVNLSKEYLRDIVSLGMASCEGSPSKENKRAESRAKSVLKWVKSAFTDEELVKIYGINLGKHKFKGASCKAISDEVSASQRTIILVGILKGADADVDLKQAIYNAMENISTKQPEKLPINPKDYLKFDILD